MGTVQLAFLWHFHQPCYRDLPSGKMLMPWVRLHGVKDYTGLAAILEEFPKIRCTTNFSPVLLDQLQAYIDGSTDTMLDLSLIPAQELNDDQKESILAKFFWAHPDSVIGQYPRYRQLLELHRANQTLREQDYRDLQVLANLAWFHPLIRTVDPLRSKGRGFTEEDKATLRQVELELLNKVIPEYREAVSRGQIEVSASPFYHPILPLLCDTDIYKRTHPDSRLPRERFRHPGDAAMQLEKASTYHEKLFGRRPVGLWPSEGSVSDEMVPLVAEAGFRWMATDELILARTLGLTFSRDARGHVEQPERLYKPYVVRAGGAKVACVFRDHSLSDLIGFTYSGWGADNAAEDFIGRLVEAGRRYRERTGGGEALIPVILDGENAWEHFEGGGRPFLRALYRRLSAHPELRTVTMGDACSLASQELAAIFPGSWIDANFYIWIGHADDQKAWSQLADARAALEEAVRAHARAEAVAAAREELLIAEGSDWFWWYGDDHSSAHDAEFDDLFRRHVRNVYRLLQVPMPDELFVTNISMGASPVSQTEPTTLLSPRLDGEETSYFEWLGAGTYEVRELAGAMHQTDRRPAVLRQLHFGFDYERLFVRVDGASRLDDLLADGREVSLKFFTPTGVRFSVRQRAGRLAGSFFDRLAAEPYWRERGPGGVVVAAGTVLELAIPLTDLGLTADKPVAFFIAVFDDAGIELERHPAHRPIELIAPDALFEARHWRA